ncbi:hypothetical protein EVAR_40953_1 [Eumeta japonica]|uniref:Uncharacterized protein n=1 Tax=Eumeta variegata TaxID=151549 RepID=A0A4C1X5G0_EUMVA|nr:hypothetical protein EVAR_40953_1 [Eumeta japonica]
MRSARSDGADFYTAPAACATRADAAACAATALRIDDSYNSVIGPTWTGSACEVPHPDNMDVKGMKNDIPMPNLYDRVYETLRKVLGAVPRTD